MSGTQLDHLHTMSGTIDVLMVPDIPWGVVMGHMSGTIISYARCHAMIMSHIMTCMRAGALHVWVPDIDDPWSLTTISLHPPYHKVPYGMEGVAGHVRYPNMTCQVPKYDMCLSCLGS